MEGMDVWRIVLLGKVGSGKSSLGNTIFGEELFKVNDCASSHSKELWVNFTKQVQERHIQLTDTPGLFDGTELRPEKFITESAAGAHAFLLVLKVERFTEQEQNMVDLILKCFSEEVLKYTTVVFTHGEDLPESTRIEDWVHVNEALKNLVQKCGGRVHVFDNINWNNSEHQYRNNQYQIKQLLKTIDQTVRENGGRCYTNEILPQNYKEHILHKSPIGSPCPKTLFSWITEWFSN